jgi:hypothetical protein
MRFLDVGDVNGDGIPDIVVSREQGVDVLFGDGTGGFKTGAWAYYEETERTPLAYGYLVHPIGQFFALAGALADLDGDGHQDLVVSVLAREEANAPKLYVFQNRGDGGLAKVWSYSLPFEAHFLWAPDFNGDGRKDLILATWGKEPTQVFFLSGGEAFRFGEPALVLERKGQPFMLEGFNADGVPDLGFRDQKQVTILLGDGRGGFLPEAVWVSPLEGPVKRCSGGDLNGDGLLDLAVLTPTGVMVALQGEDGFVEVARYDPGFTVQSIAVCDMDGDGAHDLLVIGLYGQKVVVYPGDGIGGFLGPASQFTLLGADIIPVDLNRDGRADLVVDMGLFMIVYMNGAPSRGETKLPIGGSRLLTVSDLDGNGTVDLVARGVNGIEVLWNNGQGALVHWELIAEFPKPGPGAEIEKVGEREVEAVAEEGRYFWLDRLEPVAATVADRTLFVLIARTEKDERGLLERTVAELRGFNLAGEEIKSFRLDETVVPLLYSGDFDGDGKKDVAVLKKREILILWNGEELESYPWDKGNLNFFCVGDFQGTGKDSLALISTMDYADLYIVSFAGREMEVRAPVFQFPAEAVPLALTAEDIDGDELPDPVTIAITLSGTREGGEVKIEVSGALLGMALSQQGAKTYEIPGFPKEDAPWPFSGLAVGDFTGDGIADVGYSTVAGAGVFVLPGFGDGTFGETITFRAQVGPLFSADLDANCHSELVGSTLGLNPAIWIVWNGGGR